MIGVFDSGIGGLTVIRELKKALPKTDIIYLGDTARVPYGNKSDELIQQYAKEAIDFLLSKKVKLVIAACNTVSAVALEKIKNDYDVPIVGVVQSAVDSALKVTKNKKIGVIGTAATIKSGIYTELLKAADSKIMVYEKPAPLLVPLAEEGFTERPETTKIIRYYLRELKGAGIDTLILGCTHFPLLAKSIKKAAGPKIQIISSAESLAGSFKVDDMVKEKGKLELYFTDIPAKFEERAARFLGSSNFKLKKAG